MTRFLGDSRTAGDLSEQMKWKNLSGETIPAYACIKLTTYDNSQRRYGAIKPDGGRGIYVFNGAADVPNNSYGGSYRPGVPRPALLQSGETFTVGEQLTATEDEWYLSSGEGDYFVMSDVVDDVATVLWSPSGGSASYHIVFQVVSHDPETRTAIGQIEANWPPGPVPDSYLEDTVVDLCDMMGCFFNVPSSSSLTGRFGTATYMHPRVVTVCEPNEYGGLKPRWLVTNLCCGDLCVE